MTTKFTDLGETGFGYGKRLLIAPLAVAPTTPWIWNTDFAISIVAPTPAAGGTRT